MSVTHDAEVIRESMRVLVRKLGVIERGEAACCDITLSQCHTIVEIGRAGGVTVNNLSQVLGLDKSTVSRSVDKLVTDGIIERHHNADDRRYVTLRLTQEGTLVYEAIEKRMKDYFKEVVSRLPHEKREQIIESLGYLIRALKNIACC